MGKSVRPHIAWEGKHKTESRTGAGHGHEANKRMAVQCSEFETIELDALLGNSNCSEETGTTGQPTFQHSLPREPSGSRHLNPWTTPPTPCAEGFETGRASASPDTDSSS
ncbi:hypothetical protein CEXT_461051 [Caerostris extrusa]|uniref:Uncharacterized protein n=1 Tax=Caerostris extrusa TaxID=172846 RepID=A0AAV4SJZ6_CAEEX|nr:hypothetical protein CEXT_461051 [Caerostris extrusa]